MRVWEEHWYGSVAAIRPYLFQKCLVLMVAFDLLVLMVERGARYGLDPIPFNVPHFRWLEALHAMVLPMGIPNATYYVCVASVTSFLAFCLFFVGHRAWLMALVAILYTYAWSMSRLDSYLHHYMLSLIMGCMVFFPRIEARQLRDWLLSEDDTPELAATKLSGRKSRSASTADGRSNLATYAWIAVGLATFYWFMLSRSVGLSTVQRWIIMLSCVGAIATLTIVWNRSQRRGVGPTVSSWAFRLLGTTVGVIYVFTSIAKMDAEWCGGHTLRQVGTTATVLLPIQQLAEAVGIGKEWFWAGLATFVIPLELTLAASYFVSVRQDEPNRVRLRQWCFFGWLLAIGLHLNNEMMNLIIQWFGYYMLLLATLFLLPASLLLTLGQVFIVPEAWARERYDKRTSSLTNGQAAIATGVLSFLGMALLLCWGLFTWIPGGLVASILLVVVLVLVTVVAILFNLERASMRVGIVTIAATVTMIFAVAQSSMRFDYYDLAGKTLQQLGADQEAINEMVIGAALPAGSPAAAAELRTNLGLSYKRLGDAKAAEQWYRQAISLDPRQILAHYGLANMLSELDRHAEAIYHYERALEIKPDFSDAWVNLGNLLEYQNQIERAIQCYEAALQIESGATDVQQLLQRAKQKQRSAD